MKVIVCGGGEVGSQFCRYLAQEECELTVIDRESEKVRSLCERYGISGSVGDVNDRRIIEGADAESADVIIAATSSDSSNLVTCLIARGLGSRAFTMARLSERGLSDLVQRSSSFPAGPVDAVITPEEKVAEYICQRLEAPSLLEHRAVFGTAPHGRAGESEPEGAVLIGMRLNEDCGLLETPLRQLSELFDDLDAVVVGFNRKDRLGVALADDMLQEEDVVFVCVSRQDFVRTVGLFGLKIQRCRRIVLIGAGKVGTLIAEKFSQRKKSSVVIIEAQRSQAENAARMLSRTVVLHGNGLSKEMLEEASISSADALVAVTADDKTNLVAASQGKQHYAGLVAVCLVNDRFLDPVASTLHIDVSVDPKSVAVSAILPRIRRNAIDGVEVMADGAAELIKHTVSANTRFLGKRIRNADLPENVRVAAIKRKGRIFIAEPEFRLVQGDCVAFFALREDVPELLGLLNSESAAE